MSETRWIQPVVLEGRIVRLEPLRHDHLDGLAEVAFDPSLWQWTLARPVDRAGLEAWLRGGARRTPLQGSRCPFATVDRAIGPGDRQRRFLTIVPEHRRLEIGWTWVGLAPSGAVRTARPSCSSSTHGFERLGANRDRVQDRLAQREVANRPAGDRRDVRGDLPQPHGHARRPAPALRVLQRHARGLARGEGPARRAARSLTCRGGMPPAIIGAHRAPGPIRAASRSEVS